MVTGHDILAAHVYTGGAALDLFGLSAADTLAKLTPSSDPGAASAILKTDSDGLLTLRRLTVTESAAAGTSILYHANSAPTATDNIARYTQALLTTTQERSAFILQTYWVDNADATRTSLTELISLYNGSTYNAINIRGNLVGFGTGNPATPVHAVTNPSSTNSVVDILRLDRTTSGTAADGIGAGLVLYAEDASGNVEEAGRINAVFTTAAHATQAGRVDITAMGAATGIHVFSSGRSVSVGTTSTPYFGWGSWGSIKVAGTTSSVEYTSNGLYGGANPPNPLTIVYSNNFSNGGGLEIGDPGLKLYGKSTGDGFIQMLTNAISRMYIDPVGNIVVGNVTAAGATAAGVLALGGTATAPTTSVDLVHLYGEDISAGNRALAVYQESAVIVAAGIASTHKIPVKWNGTVYYLMASDV
jgi:hypothetical protein